MFSKRQELKAYWCLNAFTPAELQSYIDVPTPKKAGRAYNSIISIQSHPIAGASIPASTILKFQNKMRGGIGYTPREKSIKKLSAVYDRYMYAYLRSLGANKENARRFKNFDPKDLNPIFRKYRDWARRIQLNHEKRGRYVPLEAIQWGMAHSQHGSNEWDNLSKTSGLQKYRRHRK